MRSIQYKILIAEVEYQYFHDLVLVVLPVMLIEQKYLACKIYCCCSHYVSGVFDRSLSYVEVLNTISS